MQATTRDSLAVVAAGMAAGLVVWAVVRLLGVDLTVESGSGTTQVDVVDVLLATLVAGLAAWGSSPCCCAGGGPAGGRSSAAPPWPISIIGPSYLADGISAVSLICVHIIVGVVLITGFMRAVPSPYGIADRAAGQRWHRG